MASETTAVTSSQNINQLIEQGDWAEVVTRFKIPLIALFDHCRFCCWLGNLQ